MITRKAKIDKENLRIILYLIPAIVSTLAIQRGDTTLAPPIVETFLSLFNWLCFIVFVALFRFKKIHYPLIPLLAIAVFLIRNVHVASGLDVNISGVLMILLLLVFSFFTPPEAEKLYKGLRMYMIVLSCIGIVISIDFLVGLGLPHVNVPYYGINQFASYENYYISYLYVDMSGIRLCGLFNEPGYMGTVIGLLLIIEKFNYHRKGNLIMLIAGFFTLSLAFFILLIVGLILRTSFSVRNFVIIVSLLIVAAVGVVIFDKSGTVTELVVREFTYDKETNSLGGHRRENDSFMQILKEFENNGPQLFGYGTGYCQKKGVEKTASVRVNFVEWGYLGSALIYGVLIIIGYMATKRNKNALVFLSCFVISIFQRPNVFTALFFIILLGGIASIIDSDNQTRYETATKGIGRK